MGLTVSVWAGAQHQREWADRVTEGLKRHGVERVADRTKADFAIGWGVRGRRPFLTCPHVLVMERAYLGDRFEWVSLGWDGLNGRANFCNEDAPSDRWDQYWKSGVKEPSRGNGALIVGQVTGDMATVGVNLNEWAKSVANGLSACGVPWSYRPHPQSLRRGQRQPFTADPRSFDEAISQCDSVITYNSNVGVLAAMAGKRVTCENDGAMAWEVAGHGWQDDKDLGDRDEWGRKLAYCQWLPHEVEAGDFWPTLSRIFE